MQGNPGRVEHMLALVWLLGAGLVLSNAAGQTLAVLALASFALILTAVWGLRLFVAIRRKIRPRLEAWLVWPGVFLLTWALHFTQLPRVVRVKLSEEGLLEAIQQDRTGRAGLFRIRKMSREYDGVYLVTQEGIFGAAGFAFVPSGTPAGRAGRELRHVVGAWWSFRYLD